MVSWRPLLALLLLLAVVGLAGASGPALAQQQGHVPGAPLGNQSDAEFGDGDRLRVYDRHGGPVWSVAFTPDGQHLLSGADGLVVTHDLRRAPDDGEPAAAEEARVAALPAEDRGAELFRKCVACHTVTPDGGHRAGPTLYGLFGRTAGSRPDYPYSSALRTSSLVWTEATVDRLFEVGPENLVPGSKMPLQRMPGAADRALLIDHLKRITAPR